MNAEGDNLYSYIIENEATIKLKFNFNKNDATKEFSLTEGEWLYKVENGIG